MRSIMRPLSLFDHSESTADSRKQSTYVTFMTLLAAKEHVLEDYTPVREVKRIKNFLVSIEKDFRSVK